MKTYESLKLDVIRFEVQDVVTTSTPEPVVQDTNCVCGFYADTAWVGATWHHDNCTADVHICENHPK